MSNPLTRRDFAIRTAGFGLAGFNRATRLTPVAALAATGQTSRSETSPAAAGIHSAEPYSLVDPELLPVLKQFPAYELTAEMAIKFRQMPGAPVTCSRAAACGAAYPRAGRSAGGSCLGG